MRVALPVVAGLVALVIAMLIVQNVPWNDAISRYMGCAAFYEGRSPYSEDVNKAIAELATPRGVVNQKFFYPAHICVVLAPVMLLPFAVSIPLWVMLVAVMVIATPLVIIQLTNWRPAVWQVGLTVLVTLVGYRYATLNVLLGQYPAFVMMCGLLCAWGLWTQRAWVAALGFAGMSIRPDGAIIAAGVALLALWKREWRALGATAGLALLILLITHLAVGTWEPAFIDDVVNYTDSNQSFGWVGGRLPLWSVLLLYGSTVAATVIIVRYLNKLDARRYYLWGTALMLTLGLIVVPQTHAYTLAYLMPLMYLLLAEFRRQAWAWWVFVLGFGVPPWFIYFYIIEGFFGIDQLIYPAVVLIGVAVAVLTAHQRELSLLATEPE